MKKRFMLLATFLVALATSSKSRESNDEIFKKIENLCKAYKTTPKPEISISVFWKIKRGRSLNIYDIDAICMPNNEPPNQIARLNNILQDPKKELELLTRFAIDVAIRWPEKSKDDYIRNFKEEHPNLRDPAIRMVLQHYFEKHPEKLAEVLDNH